MEAQDTFCQSCGMPLSKDPHHGGTNADGSRSTLYCSHCYRNGQFTDGFTRHGEMVSFLRKKLKEQGFGPLKRWFYTSHIRKLDRWRK